MKKVMKKKNTMKKKIDEYEAWHNLGLIFLKTKELSKAKQAFQRALDLNPDYAEKWLNFDNLQKILKDE